MTDEPGLLAAADRLGLRPAGFTSTGNDFLVLHAHGGEADWILRAPRHKWALRGMERERAVLGLVADRLPVEVPRWRPDVTDVAVYRSLRGTTRYEPTGQHFEDVARFLAALHAVPVEEAASTGVEVSGPEEIREAVAVKIRRARAELGLPDRLWRHWQEWLADDEPWPRHTALVHSDVKPANTLVREGRLSGVIDWTDAVVGDPAADFRRLVARFGRLAELLDAYARHSGVTWPGMRRHVEERARMAPVDSGLYGLDSKQDRYVRTALAKLADLTV